VIDKTDDGVIEAVQMNVHGKNQFAVQWHPEHNEMKNTLAQDWWIETVKSIL
jgi:gamma-glutamyl-gamma-aminobutyrate hydrolase PuuD